MTHERQTQPCSIHDVLEGLSQIRITFEKIDSQPEISPEDKRFAKQFYLKSLPAGILKAIRKHFPNELADNNHREGDRI